MNNISILKWTEQRHVSTIIILIMLMIQVIGTYMSTICPNTKQPTILPAMKDAVAVEAKPVRSHTRSHW